MTLTSWQSSVFGVQFHWTHNDFYSMSVQLFKWRVYCLRTASRAVDNNFKMAPEITIPQNTRQLWDNSMRVITREARLVKVKASVHNFIWTFAFTNERKESGATLFKIGSMASVKTGSVFVILVSNFELPSPTAAPLTAGGDQTTARATSGLKFTRSSDLRKTRQTWSKYSSILDS